MTMDQSYLPRHKSRRAIGDTFIGFSSSCVSQDFLQKHVTWTLNIADSLEVPNKFALAHTRLLFQDVERFETSDVRRVQSSVKQLQVKPNWDCSFQGN